MANIIKLEAEEALNHACRSVSDTYDGIPEGKDLEQQILAKFRQFFEKPPIATMEYLLGKTLTIEEVQITLFKPRDEQIRYSFIYTSQLDHYGPNLTYISLHCISIIDTSH